MNKKILIFVFICILIINSFLVFAARPQEISLKGRIVDINGNPLNYARIVVDTHIGELKDVYTDATGAFEFKNVKFDENVQSVALAITQDCSEQKVFYFSWSDDFNKIKIDDVLFDNPNSGKVLPDEELFKFTDNPSIDLGDIKLCPFGNLYIDSDDPVSFDITYTSKYTNNELGGAGNGDYKKDQELSHAIPINYDSKIILHSEKGEDWEKSLLMQEQCRGIHLIKRGDSITYEMCDDPWCVKVGTFGKIMRWIRGLF